MPPDALQGWSDVDITAEVEARIGASTFLLHDVSAACLAELCFGVGRGIQNFLYLYVGSFVGGGLVLSNQLQTGARGAAGAIGSLPTGIVGSSMPPQLIEKASLTGFEALVRAAGRRILILSIMASRTRRQSDFSRNGRRRRQEALPLRSHRPHRFSIWMLSFSRVGCPKTEPPICCG